MNKVFQGIKNIYKARGGLWLLKVLWLELYANRLNFQIDGKLKELLFWEKQAAGLGDFSTNFQQKVNLKEQYTKFPVKVAQFLSGHGSALAGPPKVLDVGCGPVSLLVDAHHKGSIDLTATDILIDSYSKLLIDYGYSDAISGVKTVQAGAEELGAFFTESFFDVVFCNNALDHTDSPQKSMAQMTHLTKSGGYLIIAGNCREGTHEGWDGVHMHDLFLEDGALYREGKSGGRTRLDENLPLKVHEWELDAASPVEKMFIVFQKL